MKAMIKKGKKGFTKSMACILSAALLAGSGLPVSAAENTQKDESVYVNLKQDGSVNEVYVVNAFSLDEETRITDYGKYDSVKNLTTDADIQLKNGTVTVEAPAGKFYYQGNLSQAELPWDISIQYYLDEKEVEAAELAGKSGALKIRIGVEQNSRAEEAFFENYLLQISVTMDMTRCSNLEAPGASAANAGDNRQLVYNILAGQEKEVTITADVTDFEMEAISFQGVPMSLEIDKDVLGLDGLYDKTGEIQDAADEFSDGAESLAGGVDSLKTGADGLKEGADSLKDGIDSYADGVTTLEDGVISLQEGSDELADGAAELADGLNGLRSGVDSLKDGVAGENGAASGARKLAEGAAKLGAGSSQIKEGIDSLVSMVSDLGSGMKAMLDERVDSEISSDPMMKAIWDMIPGSDYAEKLGIISGYLEQAIKENGKSASGGASPDMGNAILQEEEALEEQTEEEEETAEETEPAEETDDSPEKGEDMGGTGEEENSDENSQTGDTEGNGTLPEDPQDTSEQDSTSSEEEGSSSSEEDTVPTVPETTVPSVPETTAPSVPDTTVPSTPETGASSTPESGSPSAPESTVSSAGEASAQPANVSSKAREVFNGTNERKEEGSGDGASAIGTRSIRKSEETVAGTLRYSKRNQAGTLISLAGPESGMDVGILAGLPLEKLVSLKTGVDQLIGCYTMAEELEAQLGNETTQEQLSQLQEGIAALDSGVAELASGTKSLADGLDQLADGSSELADGVAELADGGTEFADGTQELADGVTELADGASVMSDAAQDLKDGSSQLADGTGDLADGASDLADGVGELQDGAAQFKEETTDIDTQVDEEIDGVVDRFSGSDYTPVSFVSDKNTDVGLVSFVMKTEGIHIPEETVVEVEEEPLSFWQRLLQLFGL